MTGNSPRRSRRVFLALAIAICLILTGFGAYRGIEHLVLRAQLRRMDRRMVILQDKLDRYEAIMKLLDDSAFIRLADSLGISAPDTAGR
jgi:hypothetical protein